MLFVDTGAFLARYLKNDQFHTKAVAAWKQVEKRKERCATTNFVLDEFFTLLARRTTYQFAAERARIIYSSSAIAIMRPDREDETAAVDLSDKYGDQSVSFTDCVSFVIMKRSRIRRAFCFDRDFIVAGFDAWP
jgi:predicted nucleic acid-binding protein